jgi:hypothetical protein
LPLVEVPDGSNARTIIDELVRTLAENSEELEDVRQLPADLVACTVAANDDILRQRAIS